MTNIFASNKDHPRLTAAAASLAGLRAKQLMTCPVATATEDMTLEALRHLLLDLAIGGVPVVDGAGRPIGMISKTDLLGDLPHGVQSTVGELMSADVFTVTETATAPELARRMTQKCVHRLVVVDAAGCVSGIVTSFDLLRLIGQQPD